MISSTCVTLVLYVDTPATSAKASLVLRVASTHAEALALPNDMALPPPA